MKTPEVSVNIANWNGGTDIIKCLESVYAQTYPGMKEVVVVDNGSTDGSLSVIEKKFPKVRILKNDFNMGFCKAHNQAIRVSEGEFILSLNFDILLETDFLSKMVSAALTEDRIGMVSGKLYRSMNGAKTLTLDSTGIVMRYYFPSPRGEGEEDTGQYDGMDQRYIFGPCGAAPLYRRAMLEDIKCGGEYFDEDFVNYVEDVDLAWRAQLRGWKAVYESSAVAYHERGVTRKSNPEEQRNYYSRGFRNRYLAMYKNVTKDEWKKTRSKIIARESLFLLAPSKGMNTVSIRRKVLREALLTRALFEGKRKYIQSRLKILPMELDLFFQCAESSFFLLIWQYFRNVIHSLLSKFKIGRALIQHYRSSKRKSFSS
jgi:GT2 family glycosyltransferase